MMLLRGTSAVVLAIAMGMGRAAGAQAQSPPAAPVASGSGAVAGGPGISSHLPLRRDAEGPALTPDGYAAWAIVLALALGGLWLARRARGGHWLRGAAGCPTGPAPKVVASRILGPQSSLQVVEWNGKELLLACTANGVTLLDTRAGRAAGPESDVISERSGCDHGGAS